jgi:GGDEF domain-containing protein
VAETVATGEGNVLEESRGTVRGLLRDYREKALGYIREMRNELAETAHALQDMMMALAQTDGDHEQRIRGAVARLRELSRSPGSDALRAVLAGTADTIEQSVAEMRSQHQLTINQFQTELRVLHRRIDLLETAAAVDNLTQLLRRPEMERHIASVPPGCCIVMVKVSGLRVAEKKWDAQVATELTAAFAKRLRNSLSEEAVVGRWSDEEFIAVAPISKAEALKMAKWITEHLAGPYSCLQDGKVVKPALHLSVGIVDSDEDTPERVLRRVQEFLPGR